MIVIGQNDGSSSDGKILGRVKDPLLTVLNYREEQ